MKTYTKSEIYFGVKISRTNILSKKKMLHLNIKRAIITHYRYALKLRNSVKVTA